MLRIRDNITNIDDLHVGEVYMDAQTREVYVVIGKGKPVLLVSDFDLKLAEEGFRNFDPKIDESFLEGTLFFENGEAFKLLNGVEETR